MNIPNTPEPAVNPEIDVTRFVNIDDKPFDIYNNGKLARHFEAGETQTIPVWVAEVGAKHLVDRVLQEKHGVKDTATDNPFRRSIFMKILPDMAEKYSVSPLKPEEEKIELGKLLAKQQEAVTKLTAKVDDVVAGLQKRVADLTKRLGEEKPKKPTGRPPKEKPVDEPTNT